MVSIGDSLTWSIGKIKTFVSEKELKIAITRESSGCWSYVGKWYANQRVNLAPGCEKGSTPLHEIMHALGFWHEQQRGDALDHIDLG